MSMFRLSGGSDDAVDPYDVYDCPSTSLNDLRHNYATRRWTTCTIVAGVALRPGPRDALAEQFHLPPIDDWQWGYNKAS
jgi:hypothetical protein